MAAEGGGETAHAKVRVRVNDVNDNPPYFIDPQPEVMVVEEDDRHLPATIATVSRVMMMMMMMTIMVVVVVVLGIMVMVV